MRYPLTFITNLLAVDGAAGCARGPFILIRPEYESDFGLYEHELMHVKQWAVVTLISTIVLVVLFSLMVDAPAFPLMVVAASGVYRALYGISPKFKLWAEVMAYKKQLSYYTDDRSELFAGFITNNKIYKLKVDYNMVLSRLRK
jgi:hypothetical protein